VDVQSEDDINERNCLHQATIYGNAFVLGVGLMRGVAVSRTDVYGRVPLHYACMHGRLDMVEVLLNGNLPLKHPLVPILTLLYSRSKYHQPHRP
jgi:CDK inhibitor PHO81